MPEGKKNHYGEEGFDDGGPRSNGKEFGFDRGGERGSKVPPFGFDEAGRKPVVSSGTGEAHVINNIGDIV